MQGTQLAWGDSNQAPVAAVRGGKEGGRLRNEVGAGAGVTREQEQAGERVLAELAETQNRTLIAAIRREQAREVTRGEMLQSASAPGEKARLQVIFRAERAAAASALEQFEQQHEAQLASALEDLLRTRGSAAPRRAFRAHYDLVEEAVM